MYVHFWILYKHTGWKCQDLHNSKNVHNKRMRSIKADSLSYKKT